jgi:DNA-binding transcriptional LysR family regulator
VLAATPPDLFEQQIDVSFQSGNIPDSTLVARRLTTARWHLCASPDYLARAGTPHTPDELHGHHCLNFLPGSFRSRWPLKTGDQVVTHEPKALAAANNGDVLCTLALQGLGIARLADYHIDHRAGERPARAPCWRRTSSTASRSMPSSPASAT